MKDFKGKTAVVTGAANGIGREMSLECARRGMNVVMADIDMEHLFSAEREVRALGAKTLAVRCDVTELDDWTALAKSAIETFGTVELLHSNAGVTALGDVVNIPEVDFDYCIQTNLYSTFFALKTFIPILRSQRKPAHIAVTASAAGIGTMPGMPAYYAAKHAVLGLCEPVYFDFQIWGDPIGMTILCPGMVQTSITSGDTRRPAKFAIDPNNPYYSGLVYQAGQQAAANDISIGLKPEEVVDELFRAIEEDRLYALPGRVNAGPYERRIALARNETQVDVWGWFGNFMKHDGIRYDDIEA